MKPYQLKLLVIAGAFCPVWAGAAVYYKLANSNDLHLASCWSAGGPPGPGDTASFFGTPTAQSPRSSMSRDLSWEGLVVENSGGYGCRFGPSDIPTGFHQFSLGAGGITANGTTTNNSGVVMTADLLLAANQTWKGSSVAKVLVAGNYRPAGSYIDLGGYTLTVETIAAAFSAPLPTSYSVSNGTIILTNGASLRISSGTRPTGLDPDPICDVPSSLSIQVNTGSSLTPWNDAISSENLHWNANVTLNGGILFASGYQGYFAGSADSTNNTLGGTIQVNAASSIELSSEISFSFSPAQDTLHKITAPITGNQTLSIRNASKSTARNLIVLAGDNSGFTGLVSLAADTGDGVTSGRVRLASNTAGSPGPWSIAAGNTLEIQDSSVALGYLTASGNVEAMGGGASTLRLSSPGTSTRTLNGAVSQVAGSMLHLRKAGTYHQVIASPGWNGNTTVEGGKLSLAKTFMADNSEVRILTDAVLRLTHGKVDRIGKLFFDDVGQTTGTWGAIGSGADHETARIEGSGFLRVGAAPTAYETWIESLPGISGQAEREPDADPDRDGANNFSEFAFGGDPASAGNSGRTAFESDTTLRLIVALRIGAVFSNAGSEMVSAAVDGLVYRLQAATDVGDFPDRQVMEITGFTAPPGLPILETGWEYRGFQSTTPVNSEARQFMRAVAEPSP